MKIQDIIEVDSKEYLVYDKVEYQNNDYYVLCPMLGEKVLENGYVVLEKGGKIYSVEDSATQEVIYNLFQTHVKSQLDENTAN